MTKNNNADPKVRTSNGAGKLHSKEKGSIISFKNLLSLSVVIAGLATTWSVVNAAPYTKVVQTSSGPIRGEELTYEGIRYKAFKGIPYAAPPTGNLKFKNPEPPRKWTEVRDTRVYGHFCLQPERFADTMHLDIIRYIPSALSNGPNIIKNFIRFKTASEDCLTLNVFTSSLGENGLKPVYVWIHGGGFFGGDGTDAIYGPEYLLGKDMVVVTINYRLGPIGFLSTGTPDAPGNYGMKDQVAALKWVQENIANFGGDPKQVTIHGESAGSASVHLHVLSPLSKGLFHKVIASSGSALNPWAFTIDQNRFNQKLAALMGASKTEIDDPAKRVEFLRSADSKKMTELTFNVAEGEDAESPLMYPFAFGPTIEPPGTKDAFLTEHPLKILKEGRFHKVPMIIGRTDLEGSLLNAGLGRNATPTVEEINRTIQDADKNLCKVLQPPLKDGVKAKGDCSKVIQRVRDVYFGGKSLESSLLAFHHFFGDMTFGFGISVAQRHHAKYSTKETPVFNYMFTFDGRWNMFKKLFLPSILPGAAHADDLPYIFKPTLFGLPNLDPNTREIITRDRMISFITNFVKYGNPTPSVSDLVPVKWEPVTEKQSNTLFIGDDLKLETECLKSRMAMWDELNKKYLGSSLLN